MRFVAYRAFQNVKRSNRCEKVLWETCLLSRLLKRPSLCVYDAWSWVFCFNGLLARVFPVGVRGFE